MRQRCSLGVVSGRLGLSVGEQLADEVKSLKIGTDSSFQLLTGQQHNARRCIEHDELATCLETSAFPKVRRHDQSTSISHRHRIRTTHA